MRHPVSFILILIALALTVSALSLTLALTRTPEPAVVVQQVPGRAAQPKPEDGWQALARRATPAVAVVRASFGSAGNGDAQGTAFAIAPGGWLITNEHVVVSREDGSEGAEAKEIWLDYPDGRHARARLVGRDPDLDLALLRAEGERPASTLRLGDSGTLRVGDRVATLGAPAGLQESLSVGVISALDRSLPAPGGRYSINDAIQTDARVAPGSSGGPLLDADGSVVGVVAQFEGTTGPGHGAGFAIPVSSLKARLGALRRGGVVRHAALGVTGETITAQMARELGLGSDRGVLVQRVVPESSAAKAGLRAGARSVAFYGRQLATGGDIIVSIAGKPVGSAAELAERISARAPGSQVDLELVRGSARMSVSATLGARPLR